MRGEHLRVDLPGACAVFTTRHGGVSEGPYASLNVGPWTSDAPSRVAENRRRLAALAGRPLAQAHQVHGAGVRCVAGPAPPVVDADGQATDRADVALVVVVADCLPIALVGEGAVVMLHAGWRGLAAGIVARGVDALRGLRAPGPAAAAIGPGIGGCCYEVGDDVRTALGRAVPAGADRRIDLKAVAREQLTAAGVAEIADVGVCTACDERFFSHRRDGGVTGRQAGVVWRA